MSQTPHSSQALAVRQALWSLQKELLTSLKDQFDRENGYQSAPTEWFQVLMNSERYSWLRDLTSLMADIDIMTELENIDEQHAAVARAEIERLLLHSSDEVFNKMYRQHLTHGPDLLLHHNRLKSQVQELPTTTLAKEDVYSVRKNWQELHRLQARKKRN